MRIWTAVSAAIGVVIIPTALLAAQEWQAGLARGLPTWSASADGGSLVIVCDPDRVYNPEVSYAHFVVILPRDPGARQIVFLSGTGQQASFDVHDGTATQQEAGATDLAGLVEMIQRGGTIAVVTARDTFSLDLNPTPDFACE